MNMLKAGACTAVLTSVSVVATAGIADFYAADAGGRIYRVDGDTLNASLVIDLDNGFNLNDILYLDDGSILANTNGLLVRFDLQTGEESVIFSANGPPVGSGFHFTSGLAATSDGNVYFTATTPNGQERFGGEYNPHTGEYTRLADIVSPGSLYFDHHEIAENIYLGADFQHNRIGVINALTGGTTFIDTAFGPVSFFESNGTLFSMGRDGDLYTLDVESGESVLYGNVTGRVGINAWIGAASVSNPFALPTPGTLSMLGLGSLMATRRRR